MQSDDIRSMVKDLIKNGKFNETPTYFHPEFKSTDIYDIFKHRFNEKAVATLENKTHQLIYQYNKQIQPAKIFYVLWKFGLKSCAAFGDPDQQYVRAFDVVRFVGSRAIKDKLPEAIDKVINTVNWCADQGFTKAAMVKLDIVEFMPVSRAEPEYAVVSYITMTEKGYEAAKQFLPNMFHEECGPIKQVEDQ